MVIIILTSGLVMALVYFLSSKSAADSSTLSEPRSSVVTMGVQIICGDCAGEKDPPVKTYVDRSGNCAQCGGQSYILAANRVINPQRLSAGYLSGYDRNLLDGPPVGELLR